MWLRDSKFYTLFTDKITSWTNDKKIFAWDFRHLKLTLASGATPALTATIKVYWSTTEDWVDVDFTASASATNLYDTLKVIDNEDDAGVEWDTWISFSWSTNEVLNYAINVDNFQWIWIDVTSIWVPALLTGWTSATTVVWTWTAVSDWEFAITIDWTAHDITAIDFSSWVSDMDDVAGKIQTAIRAATSSTETVVWSTDHFIVSSVDVTWISAITVTSAVSWGSWTDISWVWWTAFMDAETGRWTVTNAIIGKITWQMLLSNNQ